MELDNEKSCDIKSSCNLFAKYFQSNYNKDVISNIVDLYPCISPIVDFDLKCFSEQDVLDGLIELDSKKKAGVDNIPPSLLANCAPSLCNALKIIFNKSLSTGIFIEDWKISYINPIFKSGLKHLVKNYRPISKLSAVPKLFEKLVTKRLVYSVKEFISSKQHGFVSGRSTSTNLCLFSHFCLRSMENRKQVDVLYTDFVKAFDRVHHGLLLQKLRKLGFNANFLNWVSSYLSNRKQVVQIEGIFINFIEVDSGLPQGSHLGPILFNLFINDIPQVLNCSDCLMFADDVKLYCEISSDFDCINFQNDIDLFLNWCKYNHLQLNFAKCKIFSAHRTLSPIIFNYNCENDSLTIVKEVKDLGVIFDSKLSFSAHIDFIASKANSMLGFLKRTSTIFKDVYTLKAIFISLVLPILEYCCVVWSPFYDNAINRIERIQRRFTRFALRNLRWSTELPDYFTRVALLGLKTLESRRQVQCVLFIKDILSSNIKSEELLMLVSFYVPVRILRNRNDIFYVPNHRTNYGLNNPVTRSLMLYNSISCEVDLSMSRDCFKKIVQNLFHFKLSLNNM